MKFLGYIRPDGSVGIRNYICLFSADEGSDPVCRRVAALVKGAVAVPYQYGNSAGMEEQALKSLLAGTATNPNVGAVIIVESKRENLLASHIAEEAARTGKLAEVINIAGCGGVAGASARAMTTAVSMVRDITTYRREPVKLAKLKTGIWLEEGIPESLCLAVQKCCQHLAGHDCCIIGNSGLGKALGEETGNDALIQRFSNPIEGLPWAGKPGVTLFPGKSRKQFETLVVAAGSQMSVITVTEGHIPDHPLAPVIRVTSDRGYYESMRDTVELDFSSSSGLDPDGAGLLLLNEILATCSGRLTKSEIVDETMF